MSEPRNPTLTVQFYYRLINTLDGVEWEIWAKFMDDGNVIHDKFAPYGDPSQTIIDWMSERKAPRW